jgi:hypothetical protein
LKELIPKQNKEVSMVMVKRSVSIHLATVSVLLILLSATVLAAPADIPTIEQKTAGMQKLDGFFPLYWDEVSGKLWLEIARFEQELIYVTGLASGVGSNDIGLDRGQLGATRLVRFRRIGPKILMVQPNYGFRTSSDDPDERRIVADAFARSVIWGFVVAAESDGRTLVDLTDFLMRDVHGVIRRLRPASYRLDRSRSALHMPRTRSFPKNTEMEALLTFTAEGSTAGAGRGYGRGSIGNVTPSAEAVTVRQHHSLIELPDDKYTPRRFDPRSGFGSVSYADHSTPLGEPMIKRFIRRHRLVKQDPSAEMSDPVKPIIYYLDRGVPEPIRSALIEGAGWWNQAFEAAGFRNGFRVELLPEGADTLDVRYNVIQWVHRANRGWSYGGGVTDPRTGEILKGHVTLGSLRIRQDYLIAQGLLTPYESGTETPAELAEMALARMRQLSAHEVGHAIGFGHNYYDSDLGRISVMDYPQPLTRLLPDGTIDLSDAYAVGIGEWDKVAVSWGYSQFPEGTDREAELESIINQAWARDLRFLSGQDTSVNPRVDTWSNGTDPAAELNRMMDVRRAALDRFGLNAIRLGSPLATMEEVLVPLYLHHRFQVEAASSALGGIYYFYLFRGDGKEPMKPVPAEEQRAALDALMRTLQAPELVIPERILDNLPPRPSGYGRHRELFPRNTGPAFDPLTPAAVAADLTISNMLRPDRAARLVSQHALDPSLPGLEEVLDRLAALCLQSGGSGGYEEEVSRTVSRVAIDRMMALAATAPMPQVRAITTQRLEYLRGQLEDAGRPGMDRAFRMLLTADIHRFLQRPAEPYRLPAASSAPPGAPIGDPGRQWLPPYGSRVYSWWWEDKDRQ